jgi:tetratricopeptide (TPR) repeat protein
MGPHVRNWMGVNDDDYKGESHTEPRAEAIAAFNEAFLSRLEDGIPSNSDHFVDIIEELVGMNFPLLALKFADAYPTFFPSDDFRAHLHLGNSAMMVGDLLRAEDAFVSAQKLVTEEPAPYVNLVQIYCHDGKLTAAKEWCLSGLNVDSNNTRLWEMLAWIEQQLNPTDLPAAIKFIGQLSGELSSWAGASLACDLTNPEDATTKLAALERYWNEGAREDDFLIEFTAVLGMCGQYDRIPAIIWQAEKERSNGLKWQLILHLAQAYMGLSRDEDALKALEKLSLVRDLPHQAQVAVEAMKTEIKGSPQLN